jgi:hypothetical protein
MAFLRFGEFHKMENGKITETYVYLGPYGINNCVGSVAIGIKQRI